MFPVFNRFIFKLFVGVNFAFIVGCAAMIDSAVRTSIDPSEQTVDFIDTCGLNKNQIYDRTLSWATQTYNSSKNVIDLKDRDAGMVSINAIMDVAVGMTTLPCKYSLQIRIKDGKSKMTFTIIKMETEYGGYPPKTSMAKINSDFSAMHSSFINAINNQTKADDF